MDSKTVEALAFIRQRGCGRGLDTDSRASRGMILGLEREDLAALCERSSLHAVSKRETGTDDDLHCAGIGLVYNHDLLAELISDEVPISAFDGFFHEAYLGHYDEAADKVSLISDTCLAELLPQCIPAKSELPRLDEWTQADRYRYKLSGVQNHLGLHAFCEYMNELGRCGDMMCSSDWSWVVDGVCLAYMTTGREVNSFYIYPCKTEINAPSAFPRFGSEAFWS